MEVVVCVKQVPEVAEIDLRVSSGGASVELGECAWDINEWDNYALEQALLVKEARGGTVTAITVAADARADEMLRLCLAKGADLAVRVAADSTKLDAYAVASILCAAIQHVKEGFDLVFAGLQASDTANAQVGVCLAELLGIPYATMVVGMEWASERELMLTRELEGGSHEKYSMSLPALLAVQTGINEPRYASVLGIRRAMQKPLTVLSLEDLGRYGVPPATTSTVLQYFPPPAARRAEFFEGTAEEIVSKCVNVIRGVL